MTYMPVMVLVYEKQWNGNKIAIKLIIGTVVVNSIFFTIKGLQALEKNAEIDY